MTNQDPGAPEYEFDWQNPNYVKPQYDIGRVIGRTYKGVLKQKKPIGLAVLTYIALYLVLALPSYAATGQTGLEPDAAQNAMAPLEITLAILRGLIVWFGIVFVMIVTDAALFSEYTKRTGSFKTLAGKALRKMVPLTFGLILFVIAYYIGMIFLIIPGLFIYYGWGIFGPVYVNEQGGLFASFERSWNLMKGYKRWFFLSSFVIGMINGIVLLALFMALFLPIMPNFSDPSATATPDIGSGYIIFLSLAHTVSIILYAVFTASMTTANYLEVRQLKEGAGHADIADVFV